MIFDENFDLDDGEVEVFFEDDEHYIFIGTEDIINENNNNSVGKTYSKRKTGLPFNVYISTKQGSHDGRVKFQNNLKIENEIKNKNSSMSLSIEPDPCLVAGDFGELGLKELKIAYAFVSVNCEILYKIWNLDEDFNEEEIFDSFVSKLIMDQRELLRLCPQAKRPRHK